MSTCPGMARNKGLEAVLDIFYSAISHLVGTSLFQTFQYITVNSSTGYDIWPGSSRPLFLFVSVLSCHSIMTNINSLQTRSGQRRVTQMLVGQERRAWPWAGLIRPPTLGPGASSSLCPPDSSSTGPGQAQAHQSKLRRDDLGPRMKGQ